MNSSKFLDMHALALQKLVFKRIGYELEIFFLILKNNFNQS